MQDDKFNPKQPPGDGENSLGPKWNENPLLDPNAPLPALPKIKGALELRDTVLVEKYRTFRHDGLFIPYSELSDQHKTELLVFIKMVRGATYELGLESGEREPGIDLVTEESGAKVEGDSLQFITLLFLRSDQDNPQIIAEDDDVIEFNSAVSCIAMGSCLNDDIEFIPQLSDEACEEISAPENTANSIWFTALKEAVDLTIENLVSGELIDDETSDELDAESIIDQDELYSFEAGGEVHVQIDRYMARFALSIDEYGIPTCSLIDYE